MGRVFRLQRRRGEGGMLPSLLPSPCLRYFIVMGGGREGDQIWENAVSGRSKNFFFGGEAEVVNKSHGIVGRREEGNSGTAFPHRNIF